MNTNSIRLNRARSKGSQKARSNESEAPLKLSRKDKRVLTILLVLASIGAIIYWVLGGRNLFIFPALLCIGFGLQRIRSR